MWINYCVFKYASPLKGPSCDYSYSYYKERESLPNSWRRSHLYRQMRHQVWQSSHNSRPSVGSRRCAQGFSPRIRKEVQEDSPRPFDGGALRFGSPQIENSSEYYKSLEGGMGCDRSLALGDLPCSVRRTGTSWQAFGFGEDWDVPRYSVEAASMSEYLLSSRCSPQIWHSSWGHQGPECVDIW